MNARFYLLFISVALLLATGCKDESTSSGDGGTTIVPITDDLFPLQVGNKLTYEGYATTPTVPGPGGVPIPDPTNSYKTVWTIASNMAPAPLPGPLGASATAIVDSTTGPFGPGGFVVTVARTLLIQKDANGDFYFLQTIGPFKRLFGGPVGSTAADTLIWVSVARPSQGVGDTGAEWVAFDSTYTLAGGVVRLEILGKFEAMETITDSTSSMEKTATERTVYRSRTWRRITLDGNIVQDDATTSELWLAKDLGPAQMRIVEDSENPGHFRILSVTNF